MSSPSRHDRPQDAAPAAGVPLICVNRQNEALREEIEAAIRAVCDSGRFVLGPEVTELEEALAGVCGTKHAVGCASGSDALLLALMASGVGIGDEVVMPSYTFFATAGAVWRLGARPVFVDIEPAGFNLDPAKVEQAVTPATRAVIPVHLFGQCADMDAINDVAERHGVAVIEDAAQAIGAGYRDGKAGALGDVGCFSFYPTKNLGGFGDGGMVVAEDDGLAERMRLLRVHGMKPRYHHKIVGINSRLDSLQAAVLLVKLKRLAEWTRQRRENAQRYHELFAARGLDRVLTLPTELDGREHVWNQYVVRVPDGKRDALRGYLGERKIGTEIYYPVPLHEQECFQELGYEPESLPETHRAARETLALPIFPELTAGEQEQVVEGMASFFGCTAPRRSAPVSGPKYLHRQRTADGETVPEEG